jgi:hypothetical protein
VHSLRKFARLALKGNPTVLILLFVPSEQLLLRTQLGDELQALAPAFVSRQAWLVDNTPSSDCNHLYRDYTACMNWRRTRRVNPDIRSAGCYAYAAVKYKKRFGHSPYVKRKSVLAPGHEQQEVPGTLATVEAD